MVRAFSFVMCMLGVTQALAVDRPAVLLEAKIEYVKQTAAARAAYLKSIDAEVARLEAGGQQEEADALKYHRGAWLLGDISAEEYREFEAEASTTEHLEALEKYIDTHGECRATLKAAYESVIKEARFIRRNEEAADYEGELEFFLSGEYVPTSVEVIKPKPFDVRRIQLRPPEAAPETAQKIPDVLYVEFRERFFTIAGAHRSSGGRKNADYGKGVVVEKTQEGPATKRGYLMIGTHEPGVKYSMMTTNRTELTSILSLDELELDTVYEWSVKMIRDEFRVEVRLDGSVVASTRAFGGRGADFGFYVTVSRPETRARLVVAVE